MRFCTVSSVARQLHVVFSLDVVAASCQAVAVVLPRRSERGRGRSSAVLLGGKGRSVTDTASALVGTASRRLFLRGRPSAQLLPAVHITPFVGRCRLFQPCSGLSLRCPCRLSEPSSQNVPRLSPVGLPSRPRPGHALPPVHNELCTPSPSQAAGRGVLSRLPDDAGRDVLPSRSRGGGVSPTRHHHGC